MKSPLLLFILIPLLPAMAFAETKEDKDIVTAYGWISGATILPVVAGSIMLGDRRTEVPGGLLLASGILAGPSAGQFYAGSPGTGLLGIGMRILGAYLVLSSLCFMGDYCEENRTSIAVGQILFFGGLGFSLLETSFAVDRANERMRKAAGVQTSFAPALFPASDGRLIPGLAARVGF